MEFNLPQEAGRVPTVENKAQYAGRQQIANWIAWAASLNFLERQTDITYPILTQ